MSNGIKSFAVVGNFLDGQGIQLAFVFGPSLIRCFLRNIFEMIWHRRLGRIGDDAVYVNRLQDKLVEVEPPFTAIETVWGNGYRFRVEE